MGQKKTIASTLEIYHLESGKRDTILQEDAHFEAPNWSRTDDFLLINQNGLLYKVDISNGNKTLVKTGNLQNCNNDHGISFDGKFLAISNNDSIDNKTSESSRIYVMPMNANEEPKLATPNFPSYWHGWAPDGESLLYVAKRNGDYNIFSISVNGGLETQLTFDKGLDDGPEYAPDGKYIYYNSMKSGKMELWRMDKDGGNKTQLTNDEFSNWFPHPSPNNQSLVYIAYVEDQGDRHPAMKEVMLKQYDLETGKDKMLCKFIGGQGSINVPSWSPDGKKFAFVSYQRK